MTDRRREEQRLFLLARRRCDCGCGRVADTVVGPLGSKRLPRDRSRWRAMAWQCVNEELNRAA